MRRSTAPDKGMNTLLLFVLRCDPCRWNDNVQVLVISPILFIFIYLYSCLTSIYNHMVVTDLHQFKAWFGKTLCLRPRVRPFCRTYDADASDRSGLKRLLWSWDIDWQPLILLIFYSPPNPSVDSPNLLCSPSPCPAWTSPRSFPSTLFLLSLPQDCRLPWPCSAPTYISPRLHRVRIYCQSCNLIVEY